MKLIDKILRFFDLKKKEPIVQKEDQVNYEEMKKFNDEEPGEQNEELDDLNKEITKNIPLINIVPIPTIKKDVVDLDKFDKEVKKYEEEKKAEKVKKSEETKKTQKPAPKKKTTPKKKQVEKPVENVEEKKEAPIKKRRPKKQIQNKE